MKAHQLFTLLAVLFCFSCNKKDDKTYYSEGSPPDTNSYFKVDETKYTMTKKEREEKLYYRMIFGDPLASHNDKILVSFTGRPTAPRYYDIRNWSKYPIAVANDTGEIYLSLYHSGTWYHNITADGVQKVELFDSAARIYLRGKSLVLHGGESGSDSLLLSCTFPVNDTIPFSPATGWFTTNNSARVNIAFRESDDATWQLNTWKAGTNTLSAYFFEDGWNDIKYLPLYSFQSTDDEYCKILKLETDKTPKNYDRITFLDSANKGEVIYEPVAGYFVLNNKKIVYEMKNSSGDFIPIDTQVISIHLSY